LFRTDPTGSAGPELSGKCQGISQFWTVVTLHYVVKVKCVLELSVVSVTYFKVCGVQTEHAKLDSPYYVF